MMVTAIECTSYERHHENHVKPIEKWRQNNEFQNVGVKVVDFDRNKNNVIGKFVRIQMDA